MKHHRFFTELCLELELSRRAQKNKIQPLIFSLSFFIKHWQLALSFLLVACTNNPTPIISKMIEIPMPTATPAPEFLKGIAYTSWWHGGYSSPDSDKVISEIIEPMGVTWISVLVTCYQETMTSIDIRCKPETKTPTDEDLSHLINYAHSKGIKVMLKPHIDLSEDPGHWRGRIGLGSDETAWTAWFGSYTEFIAHYAKLAQDNNADYFVVGTELVGTSQRMNDWRAVIKTVRSIYKGPLTYAANWDEYSKIYWWDDLDAIGLDAYFPLTDTNQPTPAELKEAWKPIVARLSQFSIQWDRPIIFTEIGYLSLDGANRTTTPKKPDTAIDLQEQADCYQAVFDSFEGQTWWRGVFWWNWTTDPANGGPLNSRFTANNKPAENILRANYGAELRVIPTQ
jgi:hypothetical protein